MRCLLVDYLLKVKSLLSKMLPEASAIRTPLLNLLSRFFEQIDFSGKEHLQGLLRNLLLCLVLLLTQLVRSVIVQSIFRLPIRISQYKQDAFTDYYDSRIFA